MRPDEVKTLLIEVERGRRTVAEALAQLRSLPVENLGFARVDVHRELRQGIPEAVLAEGKTTEQVVEIVKTLSATTASPVLVTRAARETAAALVQAFPHARHHDTARIVVLERHPPARLGKVTVVAAGSSDLPVAEEAAVVAETYCAEVERITDVGVAGLHRLLAVEGSLHSTDCVIVVAGMEGALASLVGGITAAPVVAVPTSIGYGASFDGLAALLAMLNSCAAGVAVMNIDNGFGAAAFALRVLMAKQP